MGVRVLVLLVVLGASVATAHDADVIYVLAKQDPATARLVETVTLTSPSLALLAPLDADGDGLLTQADLDAKQRALRAGVWDEMPLSAGGKKCAVVETFAWLREGFVELEGRFDCVDGELRQDFRFLRVLPANYRVVLGSQLEGEGGGRGFAQGSMTSVTVPRPPPPGSWDASAFRLGAEAGARRSLSALSLSALFSVLLVAGAWRRGWLMIALWCAGLAVGGWVSIEALPPVALVVLVAVGAAVVKDPPPVIAALAGLGVGALGGGGSWPSVLGLVASSVGASAMVGVVAVSVGVMLARRGRAGRVARWVAAAVCLLSAF